MRQASKNSTESGIKPKKTDRFQSLRIYLVFSTVVIFAIFAILTQVLIKNARREQEFLPRVFAQYIAYTESYMRSSERYAELLTEVFGRYLQVSAHDDFAGDMWDYISLEFTQKIPLAVIITDKDSLPYIWKSVGVSSDSSYADISPESRLILQSKMDRMTRIPLVDQGTLTGYAYYSKPTSFEDFIRKIDQAVVVADRFKKPLFWHNLEVEEQGDFEKQSPQNRELILDAMLSMREMPLSNEADSLGYIYFTAPRSLSYIRSFIYLELVVAVLLVLLGSYGLFLVRRTEKDTLWIGLAKETAHQFGTPITSLMGWIDYLKDKDSYKKDDIHKVIEYMRTDLDRLAGVASRFGKVGSRNALKPCDLHGLLQEIVDYFSHRMPHLGSKIEIHLISKIEGLSINMDPELIKWTLENLIKNCVDAMTGKGGSIIITASRKDPWVYIHIRDEGKGIPRSQWKKIFEPGITSKTRGWGLGLSLAKRIVEEYHHGHIRVLESSAGEGSTFEIKLHTLPKKDVL
ncbi:MAG: HAMP domain-containing sensor histidine kinase [Candidatus Cloacimonadota bacterium]